MSENERKLQEDLSERFIVAYKKIPYNLRTRFLMAFAEDNNVAVSTVRQKLSKKRRRTVTEWEVLWIEGYNPSTNTTTLPQTLTSQL